MKNNRFYTVLCTNDNSKGFQQKVKKEFNGILHTISDYDKNPHQIENFLSRNEIDLIVVDNRKIGHKLAKMIKTSPKINQEKVHFGNGIGVSTLIAIIKNKA